MADYLRIYMDDQLALGVLWRETARRAAGENQGTALGEALQRVADAIAEDMRTFEGLMERLGYEKSTVKPLLATAAERVGRLKPNGHLRGYSPLSRFDELDFLTMGIEGKKQLWATLRDLAGLGQRFGDVDFDGLIERAARQKDELEPFRVEAGRAALADAVTAPA
jgi:hypothetical protein